MCVPMLVTTQIGMFLESNDDTLLLSHPLNLLHSKLLLDNTNFLNQFHIGR